MISLSQLLVGEENEAAEQAARELQAQQVQQDADQKPKDVPSPAAAAPVIDQIVKARSPQQQPDEDEPLLQQIESQEEHPSQKQQDDNLLGQVPSQREEDNNQNREASQKSQEKEGEGDAPRKRRGRKQKNQDLTKPRVLSEHKKLVALPPPIGSEVVPQRVAKEQLHGVEFVQTKAGLENTDMNKIAAIIKTASKNSEYYKTEERRIYVVKEKVTKYKSKIDKAKQNQESWALREFDVKRRIVAHSREIDISRTWVHVDMDMYFAAIEIRDEPNLEGHPVAVGDTNMIQTTNYIARKYGVKSGLPGFLGVKLCPDLVFVKADIEKYKRISEQIKNLMKEFDPFVESPSPDEFVLDITDYLKKKGLEHDLGKIYTGDKIRKTIHDKTNGLTGSCGVACNRLLSKVCADYNKPDAQTYLKPNANDIQKFMADLPVRKLPGVGKVNEMILGGLEIFTCRDLINKAAEIYINFTEKAFDFLARSGLGLGKNQHEKYDQIKKSMSVCYSFKPESDPNVIQEKCDQLAEDLIAKCNKERLEGRNLTFEFKNARFVITQRSITKAKFIGRDAAEMRAICSRIYAQTHVQRQEGLRMLCLRFTLMRDMDTGVVSEPSALIGLEEQNAPVASRLAEPVKNKIDRENKEKQEKLRQEQQNVQPLQAGTDNPNVGEEEEKKEEEKEEEPPKEETPAEKTEMQKLRDQFSFQKWRSMSYKEKRKLIQKEKGNKKKGQNQINAFFKRPQEEEPPQKPEDRDSQKDEDLVDKQEAGEEPVEEEKPVEAEPEQEAVPEGYMHEENEDDLPADEQDINQIPHATNATGLGADRLVLAPKNSYSGGFQKYNNYGNYGNFGRGRGGGYHNYQAQYQTSYQQYGSYQTDKPWYQRRGNYAHPASRGGFRGRGGSGSYGGGGGGQYGGGGGGQYQGGGGGQYQGGGGGQYQGGGGGQYQGGGGGQYQGGGGGGQYQRGGYGGGQQQYEDKKKHFDYRAMGIINPYAYFNKLKH